MKKIINRLKHNFHNGKVSEDYASIVALLLLVPLVVLVLLAAIHFIGWLPPNGVTVRIFIVCLISMCIGLHMVYRIKPDDEEQ